MESERQMSPSKKKCFVIMPFSSTKTHSQDYWNKHYELFLKPLIETVKHVQAFRSKPLRGNIANQIILDLINSDIVVADLTDYNPNVFWELGVRQSHKSGTITIAEPNTDIPFHFTHKAILSYDPHHLDDKVFESTLTTAIQDCIDNPDKSDSPVLDITSGKGTLYSIINQEENKRRINALIKENTYNTGRIKRIYVQIEQNKKRTKEQFKILTTILRTPALELLIINRYLEEKEKFYQMSGYILDIINSVNTEIVRWPSSQVPVESWFESNRKTFTKTFKDFNILLNNAKKKLIMPAF